MLPAQIAVGLALRVTVGKAFTVIVIAFDVTGDPPPDGVIVHVITSPLMIVVVVYVADVAPVMLVPPFFHW